MQTQLPTVTITRASAIATVTINNGEINILDAQMMKDLFKAGKELADDDNIKVVIVESANPDFFIAHADLSMIQAVEGTPAPDSTIPSMLQSMFEVFRNMPKATIGKIDGIARGGGSEFLLSLDMRFASIEKGVLGQPEVGLGIIAGGGGCVRLPRLIGRARTMEILLGCDDFDAQLAERYGYINRALPQAELDAFVQTLAERISHYPARAIAVTKRLVNKNENIKGSDLGEEYAGFYETATAPGMAKRMARSMELGLQTKEVEQGDLHKINLQLSQEGLD